MRTSRDEWGIQLAQVTARRGTCCRRQVGCVLVDADGHVIATGYNGVAAGRPHCNEAKQEGADYEPWGDLSLGLTRPTKIITVFPNACPGATAPSGTNLDGCEAIHAEQNALLQCPNVRAIHTAYVTCSPCVTCVKLLMNTGCQRIVFAEPYAHDQAARELWLSRNVRPKQDPFFIPSGPDTWEPPYKWIHHRYQPETQS